MNELTTAQARKLEEDLLDTRVLPDAWARAWDERMRAKWDAYEATPEWAAVLRLGRGPTAPATSSIALPFVDGVGVAAAVMAAQATQPLPVED